MTWQRPTAPDGRRRVYAASKVIRIGVVGLQTGQYVEMVISAPGIGSASVLVQEEMQARHGEEFLAVRAFVVCALDGASEPCRACARPCRAEVGLPASFTLSEYDLRLLGVGA